jgi:ubiquinol-cytochrome c reductase cytochrome c1 subunit
MRILLLVTILLFNYGLCFANNDIKPAKKIAWSFDGVFGKFDKQSIQRGFQVYKEVCSACHSIKRISFRNLMQVGFSEGEAKTIAADYQIKDGPNDAGDMFTRPSRISDRFPLVYPNDNAARAANNGALPPDLSLIVKARHDGANYIYSILTGYNEEKPVDFVVADPLHYNPYFSGYKIGMPPPLADGQITFQDGTASTVDQMSYDVVSFLQWASEPEMQERKSMGVKVLIFIAIMTFIFHRSMRKIWANVK